MKTRLLFLIAVLATAMFGQTRSFSANLTATGTTSAAWVESNYHTVQVTITGAPAACSIRLEGSLDGTTWFDISGSQTCTSSVMFHVDGKPVSYVRANLLTFSGGTSPAAAVAYKGNN